MGIFIKADERFDVSGFIDAAINEFGTGSSGS
jgi:hypothetical protein